MKESRKSTLTELNDKNKEINTQSSRKLDKNKQSASGSNADLQDHSLLSEDKSRNKKQNNLKDVHKNISKHMPVYLSERNEEENIRNDEQAVNLDEIESLLDIALEDTGRAALYYKVRDAIKLYRAERDQKAKINMLLAVRESAFNYLLEKKGNAPARKRICNNIVRMVDSYTEAMGINTERNLDYLVENERVSDKKLDMEIMLAGKLTVKSGEAFDGNLSDRRKAFKRKIKDVRLARTLKKNLVDNRKGAFEHLDNVRKNYVVQENERNEYYDDSVKNIVASYMNLSFVDGKYAGIVDLDAKYDDEQEYRRQIGANMLIRLSASDDNKEGKVSAKCHMIEAILMDILNWNPADFKFREPEDFLNRKGSGQRKLQHFMDLYNKLRIADHADVIFNELLHYRKKPHKISCALSNDLLKEVKAKINLFKEIKKEYTGRLEMMTSPYYALLLQEDTRAYDTPTRLDALTKDKRIEGTDSKKSVGSAFKKFIKSLADKSRRMIWGKNGGGFTRNTDPDKLLKWYRNKANATATISKRSIEPAVETIDDRLKDDNTRFAGQWKIKGNPGQIMEGVNHEEIKDIDLNLINIVNEDQEENLIKNKDQDDNLIVNEGRGVPDIPLILAPEENKEEKNKPEEKEEENKAEKKAEEKNPEQKEKEEEDKKAAFRSELKGKQSEISDKAGAKAGEIDAELEKQSRERIKKQIEEDKLAARRKQWEPIHKGISEKQPAITAKSPEWLKKYEEAENARANERILLSYLLEGYEKLAKGDIPMADAYALRERMIERLIAFTGVDSSVIEFIPADELVKFVKYALDNQFAAGAKEELARQIEDLDDSYGAIKDDKPLLERVKSLLAKGDKMTAQDKLLAYDYNALLICMNRSREEGDVKYDDYKTFDLDYLTKYAEQTSRYTSTQPDDESFDDVSEEQARSHEAVCREILSEYTGKDADYFRVIPIAVLSEYAFDVHDIIDKKKSKTAADKCLKLAREIHGRIRSIDDALKKNDRAGILETIVKLSGIDAGALEGYATIELRDVLESMYFNVNAPEELARETADIVTKGSKLFDADYYLDRLRSSHKRVWLSRDLGDEAGFEDLRSMAEYSILYLKKHPGLEDLTFDDFVGLSADSIYYIYRNVGIIEGLKGTTDPYEQNDLANAILELSNMGMSDKLFSTLEKTLDIKPDQFPEYTKIEKKSTYMIGVEQHEWKKTAWLTELEEKEALKKKSIEERSKGKEMTPEYERFLLINENIHRGLDKIAASMRKKIAAKVETEEERTFSGQAVSFLNILGDITVLTGAAELDSALDKKIGSVLSDHAEDIAALLKQGSDKRLIVSSVFAELKADTTQGEKAFFEACENSFMPVINALSEALGASKSKEINGENVKKILESEAVSKALKDYATKVDANMELFEKEMLPVMSAATADVYNRGEDNEALPDVTELMSDDMKALISLIDSEEKKDRIAAAKNTKERQELQKKTKEQANKERGMLNDMQESLLYDSKKGQGRFNQLLISGYYKNASRADKRRMLSHVIRDLKKNNANITDKEKGCEYFASTMKGAGPLMQKMMQGVPERMLIPEMSGALGVVKSSLAHIDPKYVDKVFKEMIKDSNGAITSITERTSLGAASVAETFKCKIAGPNIKPHFVVVKILRPDAQDNMKKDLKFVRMSAMFADMTDEQKKAYEKKNGLKLVKHDVKVTESGFLAQFSEIEKEFDFTNEAENAKLGQKNYVDKYNKKKDGSDNYRVKSVRINENFAPKKHYLVMDMAEGTTVDKVITQAKSDVKTAIKTFKNTDTSLREPMVLNSDNVAKFWKLRKKLAESSQNSIKSGKLCAKLAYVWLEQALFGSKAIGLGDDPNFHHGDMHAGNIMVDGKNTTILDYGNAVILKDSKVNQILSMLSAAVLSSSKHFVEAFNNLLVLSAEDEKKSEDKVGYAPLTDAQQKQFITRLDELFKLGTAEDTGKKILIALNVAQSLGVKLPKEIQNFSQCQQRLENTLQEVKDGAIKTPRMVDTMDALNIAPEDEDSVNPLIKLHMYHRNPLNRNKESVKQFAEKYNVGDNGLFMTQAANAGTKQELDKIIGEYMPEYFKFKEKITAGDARAKAAEIRLAFNEAVGLVKSGNKVPHKLAQKMADMSGDMIMLCQETDDFGGFIKTERMMELVASALSPMDQKSYDEAALEQIIVVLESYIPEIIEGLDSIYETLPDVSKDIDKERKRRTKVSDIVYNTTVSTVLCKPEAMEIRKCLKGTKDPEKREKFERQNSEILDNLTVKKSYDKYRKAEEEFDKAKLSGDKDALDNAEKNLKLLENDFLYSYMVQAYSVLYDIADVYEANVDMDYFKDEDYLPDFVGVMGDVVSTHWKRSAAKVNKSLASEIKKRSKEQDDLEKKIKKEEEAEAKKLKEEETRKKKEEEAAAKKKKADEEKKKKAAKNAAKNVTKNTTKNTTKDDKNNKKSKKK